MRHSRSGCGAVPSRIVRATLARRASREPVRERAEEVKTRRSIEMRLQQRPGLRQGRIRQCAVERNERNPAWRIERLWRKQRHKCAARHKLYPEVIL